MIKVKYNVGSKPHKIGFNNSKELGDWIIKNYHFRIINVEENKEDELVKILDEEGKCKNEVDNACTKE